MDTKTSSLPDNERIVSQEIEPFNCPQCGCDLSAVAAILGQNEDIGLHDIGLCFRCGAILRLDAGPKFHRLTATEFDDLPADLQLKLNQSRRVLQLNRQTG